MPTQPSRNTVGLRTPDGFLNIEHCQVAWAAFPPLAQQATNLQPIVCLHDIGSGSREFQPLLERAPEGSRLILFDWPGHGNSRPLPDLPADSTSTEIANLPNQVDRSCATLHAVLNQLQIPRPVILLGSGFGAAVAIRFASQYSSETLGIIACQPTGLIPSESDRQSYSRGFWSSCFPQRLKSKKLDSSTDNPESSPAAHRQALRLEALQPEMRPLLTAAASSLEHAQPPLRTGLFALETPILFALSRYNRKYPLRSYMELLDPLLARSPQHRITVFTGNFHPAWDEPDRFAQALNAFVQSQLPFSSHHHAWLLTAVDYPTENMNLWKCVHPACEAEKALPTEANPNAS